MRAGHTLPAIAAIALFAPRFGHAQGVPEPPSSARLWLGGDLAVSPVGTERYTTTARTPLSSALNTMYSAGLLLDYRVSSVVSVGLAPAVIFNWGNVMLLGLPARLTVGGEFASGTRLYAFATAGYEHSIGLPSDLDPGGEESDAGFIAGAGAGVAFRIAPRLVLNGELGYQFHALTERTFDDGYFDIPVRLHCLVLSLGLVAPFR
ncbi:MAG TPA: hypothetical protein VIW26_04655 [Gemmatimonadales bacterium]